MLCRLCAALCLCVLPSLAAAHPVSFQGATSLMLWNQPFLNEIMATYSFRSDAAVAGTYMRMDMEDGEEVKVYLPQLNVLVHRWNGDEHQANVYAVGGWGGYERGSRQKSAALAGLEMDYETRRIYTSAKATSLFPSFGPNMLHTTLRGGLATREAEFDEIGSWFIVEVQHNPQLVHTVTVTPLLRLYYRNILTEVGSSLEGDWMLNFMVHY